MDKIKNFDFKGLLSDLCFLVGTMVLGYVNFFVYGQYTALCQAGVFSALVHRILIAVTITIVGFLYFNVTKMFLDHRDRKSWLFWLTMFTAALSVILAVLFVIFGIGSEYVLAYVMLCMELYPFFVVVIIFLYYFVGYVKKEFNRKPDRLR